MNPTALVTYLMNKFVPPCAVRTEARPEGLFYLHPRKGWRCVSWKRMGIIPQEVD